MKSSSHAPDAPARRRRGFAATVVHEFRYDVLTYVRNYQSLFFTLFLLFCRFLFRFLARKEMNQ